MLISQLSRRLSIPSASTISARLFSQKAKANSIITLGTDTPAEHHLQNSKDQFLEKPRRASFERAGSTPERPAETGEEPSFYSDEIDRYAAKPLQPITLQRLLEICEPPLTQSRVLANSQFLCSERPVRYAKRTKLFQRLPYIVGLNPHINRLYQIYYRHFEESRVFPMISSWQDQRKFIQMLARQSDALRDVMPNVARGFYECQKYISIQDRCDFLDEMIKMRIGLRLLTSQHLALYHQYQATVNGSYTEETDNGRYQGIIDNRLRPAHVIRLCAQGVQAMSDMAYGDAPGFVIDGDVDITFCYIPSHIEYLFVELLKNAFRSTVRRAQERGLAEIPPVRITISRGRDRVAVRIRDRGGGILQSVQDRVFEYSFTTVSHDQDSPEDDEAGIMDQMNGNEASQNPPIAGLGFGLPMSKLYAEYFGGSLNLISLDGYGCDAFLELPSIEVKHTPKIEI